MDLPKTRSEKKGNKEKRNKELGKYTLKYVRIAEDKKSRNFKLNKN